MTQHVSTDPLDPADASEPAGAAATGTGGAGAAAPDDGEIPTKTLATVWLALFLDLAGFGMILPVLPFYAEHFGASPTEVALLSTAFSLAQFVMSPVLGRLSDSVGRRPVMLVSIAGSCFAMLTLGFATSLAMVFAARVLSGMANANVSTANAYVADRVPPHKRAKYMGLMGTAIGLGFIFGPSIGGLLATPEDISRPFLVAAGLAAVNWVMALAWLPESTRRPVTEVGPRKPLFPFTRANLGRLWGTALGGVVALNFAFFFAFANMEATMALLSERRFAWTARDTGYMFTVLGVCSALTQAVLVGRLVPRLGERRALMLGMGVLSTGLLAIGLATAGWVLYVAAALIACGNGLVMPSVNALVSRMSHDRDQGLNLGLNASAASFGRMTGPVLGGAAFERLGHGVPMFIGAAVLWAAIVGAAMGLPRDAGTRRLPDQPGG
jgi:MFS family permease